MLLHDFASKTNHKRVSSLRKTPLVLGQAMGNLDSLDSPQPKLGGSPPPSPIQYSLQLSAEAISEWHFFPGLPKWNPEIVLVCTPGILGIHNFLLRPLIEMNSEAILQFYSRAFKRQVAHYLQTSGSGRFPTFSDQESNCQFNSRPFFCP